MANGAVGIPPYGLSGPAPGSTHFLHADSDDVTPGRRNARLVSPIALRGSPTPDQSRTFTFWYRAFGSGIQVLELQLEEALGQPQGQMAVIWNVTTGSRDWQQASPRICHGLSLNDFRVS